MTKAQQAMQRILTEDVSILYVPFVLHGFPSCDICYIIWVLIDHWGGVYLFMQPSANVEMLHLDLASLHSVKDCVQQFTAKNL